MSNPIYSFNVKGKKSLSIRNAKTGQVIKTVNVDGEIIGSPNVSGDTGIVNVKKGNITKTYVYNLKNGTIQKIYTT